MGNVGNGDRTGDGCHMGIGMGMGMGSVFWGVCIGSLMFRCDFCVVLWNGFRVVYMWFKCGELWEMWDMGIELGMGVTWG